MNRLFYAAFSCLYSFSYILFYHLHDNIPDGKFTISTKQSGVVETVFAEQVTDKIKVQTSWREILTANRDGVPHGSGDYILYASRNGKPDLNDSWVVNGLIFEKTYERI